MWKYIILCIIIIVLIAAFYNGLIVKRYIVTTNKFNGEIAVRAVLISDLHGYIYGKNQQDLILKITEQKPDIILLAGDIIDEDLPLDGAKLLFEGIKNVAPVFYVTGNHEYWTENIENIKRMIRSYGITVLEDEYKELEVNGVTIIVAGIDDPEWPRFEDKKYKNNQMSKNFARLKDRPEFKILLAHRPEQIELYKKYTFDLVVSGHAHGGQVRIPFLLNGLFAPNQGMFPKYAGGLYTHDSLIHIVSRGVSFNPLAPRVFNPPEVSVIDITR